MNNIFLSTKLLGMLEHCTRLLSLTLKARIDLEANANEGSEIVLSNLVTLVIELPWGVPSGLIDTIRRLCLPRIQNLRIISGTSASVRNDRTTDQKMSTMFTYWKSRISHLELDWTRQSKLYCQSFSQDAIDWPQFPLFLHLPVFGDWKS